MDKTKNKHIIISAAAIVVGFALRKKGKNEILLSPEQRITQQDAISIKDIGNIMIVLGSGVLVYNLSKK